MMQDPSQPTPPPFASAAQPLQYMTPTAPPYAGRKSGLTVFGILMLGVAGLCVLVTLGSVASFALMRQQTGFQLPLFVVVQTIAIYALAAIGLICVGIGSIRARRWVRPVVVPISAVALLGAIVALVGSIGPMLSLGNARGPAVIGVMIGGFILLLFCAFPAATLWFYGSVRTRDALWYYDPHPSRAEAVPLPVFSIALLSGLGALSLVGALFVPINPTFGAILRGPLAVLVTALTIAALVAVCVLCYRRSMLGWWLAMAVVLLGVSSNAANIATGASRQLAREMIDEMYTPGPYTATGTVTIQTTTGPAVIAPTTAPAIPPAVATAQLNQSMRDSMYAQVDAQSLVQMVGVVAVGLATAGYLVWARKFFADEPGTAG